MDAGLQTGRHYGEPEWAITLFSLTSELLYGNRSPQQILEETLKANVADNIEIDAPQFFASYPRIDQTEKGALRDLIDTHGATLTLLGVYNDRASRRDRLMSDDEMETYVATQLRDAKEMGFQGARIQIGVDRSLLERLAVHADRFQMPLLQEVQGVIRPEDSVFQDQWAAVERIDSPNIGFVFDVSACMPRLPVTYLQSLQVHGMTHEPLAELDRIWTHSPAARIRLDLRRFVEQAQLDEEGSGLLRMVLTRFGSSRISDWHEFFPRFAAFHLKFWDTDDRDRRITGPLSDLKAALRATGYVGAVTSEWGGHEWFADNEPGGVEMMRRHRELWDQVA